MSIIALRAPSSRKAAVALDDGEVVLERLVVAAGGREGLREGEARLEIVRRRRRDARAVRLRRRHRTGGCAARPRGGRRPAAAGRGRRDRASSSAASSSPRSDEDRRQPDAARRRRADRSASALAEDRLGLGVLAGREQRRALVDDRSARLGSSCARKSRTPTSGSAPTKWPASCPSRTPITIGMLCTRNAWARPGFSSVFTRRARTRRRARRPGARAAARGVLHGPHHGAQKSTTTGTCFERSMTRASKSASVTSNTWALGMPGRCAEFHHRGHRGDADGRFRPAGTRATHAHGRQHLSPDALRPGAQRAQQRSHAAAGRRDRRGGRAAAAAEPAPMGPFPQAST